MCSLVNARGKNFSALSLPLGYYGNVFVYPATVTEAGDLSQNSLKYTVKLVKKPIAEANEEYFRSVVDFLVTKGRPLYKTAKNLIVSDNKQVGNELYMQRKRGEGIVVPISLPLLAMERLELKKMIST